MSDLRSSLLRLASELPAGDPVRREMLYVLAAHKRQAAYP